MRILKVFILLFLISFHAISQNRSFGWFPDSTFFSSLNYDLLENNFYTGVLILEAQSIEYNGAFIPVNIGLQKTFLEWSKNNVKLQFALGAASYTQFEIIKYDSETLRGGLLNNDYKASGYLSALIGGQKLRMQLFHISSHLGDDYMLRNEHFELNDKTVNYEQLDLVYQNTFKNNEVYGGFGYVVSPNAFRKRGMMQFGFQAQKAINSFLSVAYGTDIKLYEEHDWSPNIHTCLGVNIIKEVPQFNISIDTYYGKIPYSTLKMGTVIWYGISSIVFI